MSTGSKTFCRMGGWRWGRRRSTWPESTSSLNEFLDHSVLKKKESQVFWVWGRVLKATLQKMHSLQMNTYAWTTPGQKLMTGPWWWICALSTLNCLRHAWGQACAGTCAAHTHHTPLGKVTVREAHRLASCIASVSPAALKLARSRGQAFAW